MTATADAPILVDPPTLELTVVVPFYNTGPRVRETVDGVVSALRAAHRTFEVVCVSDGSTDASEDSLAGVDPSVVRLVRLDVNQGKGQALRTGFAAGRGRWIGFIDGDGDIPADQLRHLVAEAFAPGLEPDVVLGSKLHPGSDVVYTPMRRTASWAWQLAVAVAFNLRIRDTQCGLKLLRRDVLAAVLPRTRERRFAFDLELLVVARHLGYRSMAEVPVRIKAREGSTISPRSALRMLADLVAIAWRLRVRRAYDLPRR